MKPLLLKPFSDFFPEDRRSFASSLNVPTMIISLFLDFLWNISALGLTEIRNSCEETSELFHLIPLESSFGLNKIYSYIYQISSLCSCLLRILDHNRECCSDWESWGLNDLLSLRNSCWNRVEGLSFFRILRAFERELRIVKKVWVHRLESVRGIEWVIWRWERWGCRESCDSHRCMIAKQSLC